MSVVTPTSPLLTLVGSPFYLDGLTLRNIGRPEGELCKVCAEDARLAIVLKAKILFFLEMRVEDLFPLLQKIEKIQERALRFIHNDHFSSYNDLRLKSERCTTVCLFPI